MKARIAGVLVLVCLGQLCFGQNSRIGRRISTPGNTGIGVGRSAASYTFQTYSYGLRSQSAAPSVGPLSRDLSSRGAASFDIRRGVGVSQGARGSSNLVPHSTRRYGGSRYSAPTAVSVPRAMSATRSVGTPLSRSSGLDLAAVPGPGRRAASTPGPTASSLPTGTEPVSSLAGPESLPNRHLLVEAETRFKSGDFRGALRYYRRYIGRSQTDPRGYVGAMLAGLHQAKSRFGIPAGYLSQALKYDPTLVHVPFDFQALHGRQQGQSLDQALDKIEESILQQGPEPDSLLMRAYFRFRKGQDEQARQDLVEARRLQEALLDENQRDNDQLLEAIKTFLNQLPEAQ